MIFITGIDCLIWQKLNLFRVQMSAEGFWLIHCYHYLLYLSKWSQFVWREFFEQKTWCQFHQHFKRYFFVPKFCAKLFCTSILGLNFFWWKNIGVNALVKLTTGLPELESDSKQTTLLKKKDHPSACDINMLEQSKLISEIKNVNLILSF